ncbi:MAG TPA: alpha/beta fold hydrolase [Vicinamibacterales bacterium]|nr:alpha/beta fold hydrolase [Vicinamibacterales bacterium]
MTTRPRMLIAIALIASAFSARAAAAPCTTTKAECTEWIVHVDGPSRSLVYRTYPLEAPNAAITRALVMVHGAGRDADNYFRTAIAAAFLAGALDDTIVVSPRFASKGGGCNDMLAQDEVSWPCNGDSWRSGGAADKDGKLTSYDFADAILKKFANKRNFPNLKAIVVAGHSAGGQFVNRYEMANQVHDALGIPITYVVANPSSYAYLDPTRPSAAASGATEFRPFGDGRNCTTYDKWPYGLQGRTGYASRTTDDVLKKQLVARPTTYLVGELDTLPLAGFDSSCPAMAQGANRNLRGQAWGKYVNEKLGAHHMTTVVPLCGHNARCMFTADPVLALLFPKP